MTKVRLPILLPVILWAALCPFGHEAVAGGNGVYALDELIALALEKNPSESIFRANLESSKGKALAAHAFPNPTFEFQAGRGTSLETGKSKDEYTVAITQPLELPRKRHYREKAAEAETEAIQSALDDYHLQLRSEVARTFYLIHLNKKAAGIAAENSRIAGELLKTVEIRVKAGEAPEFELVKARVEMLRADKEMRRSGNILAISKASLNSLLGGALHNDFDVAEGFSLPEKKYQLKTLLAHAREHHPQVTGARKAAQAKEHSLDTEKASLFQDISVRGFSSREVDRDSYGIGVSISLPLWNRRSGETAAAYAEKAKAEADVCRTMVELEKTVTQEYQNYLIALDQIEVFEHGLLKEAAEALRIADLSYRQGESSILELIDAQRVNSAILNEYFKAFYEVEISLAALERAAGGLPE